MMAIEDPPANGPPGMPPGVRRGRPCLPDTRRHRLRIPCNDQELVKFQLLSALNHDMHIATMARDIILDEVNALLADCPHAQIVAWLEARGFSPSQIDALLGSL